MRALNAVRIHLAQCANEAKRVQPQLLRAPGAMRQMRAASR